MFTMEYKSGSIAENIRFEVLDGIGPVVLAEVRVGGSYAVASKLLSKECCTISYASDGKGP